MTKTALRKRFLAERKALCTETVAERSRVIAERFFDFAYGQINSSASSTVHTFLPIQRQNEVDTWLIIYRLWQNFPQVRVITAVTNTTSNLLTHYQLTPQTELRENRWGIPEPVSVTQPINPSEFDIVLVPLLAFDLIGHRVGYGKGYYDRFLSECRPDCLKLGLSLFEPIELIPDIESTDIPLDFCLTAEQVYTF
ncbi:5-formyltetrahydrofolate cyclo-ligase [Fibrisoma limi BUZ 3]|uniref:5-formyltetrahydrofolate cyclo-ligase n=1 Tax=Fibrisoma limi BUZ 3 TaxID=1185876 RepID=I2GR51_9BACT|nr:5-formyltetrahydrofolate cyclo-ligase [Fibrisoma limi]CCH56379.1 5-formyltetrahydrofolate cyclo-ligase [Fibrisoma limi BUZ 3]